MSGDVIPNTALRGRRNAPKAAAKTTEQTAAPVEAANVVVGEPAPVAEAASVKVSKVSEKVEPTSIAHEARKREAADHKKSKEPAVVLDEWYHVHRDKVVMLTRTKSGVHRTYVGKPGECTNMLEVARKRGVKVIGF